MVGPESVVAVDRVVIRPSTHADAEAASRCHLTCWRETYRGMMADAALDRVTADLDARVARWHWQIDRGDTQLIAAAGGDVVGLATTIPARDDDIDLAVELAAIYTRRAWWGTGLGNRLIVAALGDGDAYLWVLEANHRAQAFYAKHAFRPDGTVKELADYQATEIRMVRRRS